MMKTFGVVGKLILHSLSPEIFGHYAGISGINAAYTRILAGDFASAMKIFDYLGLTGINITAPFKKDAIKFCDEISPNAEKIGAINLIKRTKGKFSGYNTDIIGVGRTLAENGVATENAKILVLGAGNAAKSVLQFLSTARCREVVLMNRLSEHAMETARKFNVNLVDISRFSDYIGDCDLLISTLPGEYLSIKNDWKCLPSLVIFDANYKNSKFKASAEERGLKFIDGRQWLINQALPSFEIFTETEVSNDGFFPQKRELPDNIALIGFSGAGKSTIGKILAQKIKKPFVDIDKKIEQREQRTISEIFAIRGEKYFRQIESEMLQEVMNLSGQVVSCGGGIIESDQNRNLLKKNVVTAWLVADVAECVRRIVQNDRPKLPAENRLSAAEKLFGVRREKYFASADLVVANFGNEPEIIADLLVAELA